MGVVVAFDPNAFLLLFPQFATNVDTTQLTTFILPLAEQYCRNDGGGPVCTALSQTNLLNLMVAHICALFYGVNGNAPSPLVGMINSAAEGTVNVGTDWFPMDPTNAWYQQTPWGAAFYAASAQYRRMRYVPARQRYPNQNARGWW